ncbi:PIN domain-containing protein [Asticcacaulis sp. AND118]|uniref:PIN domain-containing protein n=1 Tax=Asticcacaulis sp. AND118 TaxID=2840468 RepID=UPI001CFFB59B|nr:PIN domain-containing protein [Asticcacaulis sp. AND118]UDF05453.1 PIN domain-containing protein [Asticcacaulis sp. AND118]
MYLLDTPIVMELRKAKAGDTDPGLIRWASGVGRQHLFLSVLSLLELETSVAAAERREPESGRLLRQWLDEQVPRAFENHILPIDAAVAKRRATLTLNDSRDALMAATAAVHGLMLVTPTPAAFRAGKVKTFNPFGYAPEETDTTADWREAARSGPQWFRNLFVRF